MPSGLIQGAMVPSQAIVVRGHFAPLVAGARVGAVRVLTLSGMEFGGAMSGEILVQCARDGAALVKSNTWNGLSPSIAAMLAWRARGVRLRPYARAGGRKRRRR